MARAIPVISISRPRKTNSGTASRIRLLMPSSMRETTTVSGVLVAHVDPEGLGAVPLQRACLAHGGRTADVVLPFRGWGLPRAVMDAALLDAAEAAGAVVRRGRAVVGAARDGGMWRVRLAGGERLAASLLVQGGQRRR